MRFDGLAALALLVALVATGPGCAGRPNDPGVPKEAVLVPAAEGRPDRVGFEGLGSAEPERLVFEPGGALYVYDATGGRMAYSGPVDPGQVILLYPTGVAVAGRRKTLGGVTLMEHRVTGFDAGRRYRVYVHAGAPPVAPTPPPTGSPLTRPFQMRERVLDPTGSRQRERERQGQ